MSREPNVRSFLRSTSLSGKTKLYQPPQTKNSDRPVRLSTKKKKKANNPDRVYTDTVLTIKPEFAELIAKREKNHEYRKYELRSTVERLWLYETAPTSAITYVVATARPKQPGEVNDPSGVGNDDFDNGLKQSKFGYPVLGLYKLRIPITLSDLKQSYGIAVPQGFCYATRTLVEGLQLEDMDKIF